VDEERINVLDPVGGFRACLHLKPFIVTQRV